MWTGPLTAWLLSDEGCSYLVKGGWSSSNADLTNLQRCSDRRATPQLRNQPRIPAALSASPYLQTRLQEGSARSINQTHPAGSGFTGRTLEPTDLLINPIPLEDHDDPDVHHLHHVFLFKNNMENVQKICKWHEKKRTGKVSTNIWPSSVSRIQS